MTIREKTFVWFWCCYTCEHLLFPSYVFQYDENSIELTVYFFLFSKLFYKLYSKNHVTFPALLTKPSWKFEQIWEIIFVDKTGQRKNTRWIIDFMTACFQPTEEESFIQMVTVNDSAFYLLTPNIHIRARKVSSDVRPCLSWTVYFPCLFVCRKNEQNEQDKK